jgi:hypothetical protein
MAAAIWLVAIVLLAIAVRRTRRGRRRLGGVGPSAAGTLDAFLLNPQSPILNPQ